VEVVVAKFFARIFYRNCINLGIPAIECAEADRISEDDELDVDPAAGVIQNKTKGECYRCSRIPEHIYDLIEAGGLIGYLKSERRGGQ
jgi:3-isopropylmalate/(R)-2-methylmalate dehydratase small subunit